MARAVAEDPRLEGGMNAAPRLAIMHRQTWIGIGIGVGVALALPVIGGVVVALVRPLAKTIIKQNVIAFEKLREVGARALEDLEDIFAEIRDELHERGGDSRGRRHAEADGARAGNGAGDGQPQRGSRG